MSWWPPPPLFSTYPICLRNAELVLWVIIPKKNDEKKTKNTKQTKQKHKTYKQREQTKKAKQRETKEKKQKKLEESRK